MIMNVESKRILKELVVTYMRALTIPVFAGNN